MNEELTDGKVAILDHVPGEELAVESASQEPAITAHGDSDGGVDAGEADDGRTGGSARESSTDGDTGSADDAEAGVEGGDGSGVPGGGDEPTDVHGSEDTDSSDEGHVVDSTPVKDFGAEPAHVRDAPEGKILHGNIDKSKW